MTDFYKKHKNLIDQPAHMAWAIFALWPLVLWHTPWAFALSGFLIDVPRELWDQRPDKWTWEKVRGKTLDLLGFTAGGFLLGLLV